MFCKAKSAILDHFKKNVQIWAQVFPLLFPKNFESLKILDIQLQEVGGKKTFIR